MSKIGYIYKLCCKDPTITDCYVGSTKNERVRKNRHKTNCVYENGHVYNYYVYQFIREHGGFENWDMIRLEEYKYDDRVQLNARERYWIENLKVSLNKIIPTRTPTEYYELNKEIIHQRIKKYRQKNKEIVADRKKIKTTCECGSIIRKEDIARHERSKKHNNFISPHIPV